MYVYSNAFFLFPFHTWRWYLLHRLFQLFQLCMYSTILCTYNYKHFHLPFNTWMCVYLLHRLFHIVVDTDRTASQILSIMNKQKLHGEVTFLPLNKLNPSNPHYPTTKVRCVPYSHVELTFTFCCRPSSAKIKSTKMNTYRSYGEIACCIGSINFVGRYFKQSPLTSIWVGT